MVERVVIDEMLAAYRFDEAEALIARAGPGADAELRDLVTQRRAEAEQSAHALYERIIELAGDSRHSELAGIAHDRGTYPLLGVIAEATRHRAERHLREAQRWEVRRVEINARRLGEARRALAGLDLELARGLMKRIDGRFLTDELAEERDQLLLDISARTMELEAVEEGGRKMMGEGRLRSQHRDRRWWHRWLG